jgi:F-box interacting protein
MANRRLLPHDLQKETLVRLPVKSLLRFQCVCKSWKSFIRSPRFIAKQLEHSESTDNYVHLLHSSTYNRGTQIQLQHCDGSFREIQKLELPCQIGFIDYEVLDCKGLILFKTTSVRRHYLESLILWNPAIRISITLPPPCIDAPSCGKYCVYGFGFDHTTNDYKVMRMVLGRLEFFPFEAQLYKLSTGAWETIRGVDNFQYVADDDTQALVNGASHWLGYHKSNYMAIEYEDREYVIVSFHMCHEEFRVMILPDHLSSRAHSDFVLRVSGGLLCLIEKQDGYLGMNIWLMKEYGVVESWTKQFTTVLKGFRFGEVFGFSNNEKILGEKKKKPALYNPKTQRSVNLRTKVKGSYFAKNSFVESLVLLNEVNSSQMCQNCLSRGRWCDSKKRKEKKRKTCTREG